MISLIQGRIAEKTGAGVIVDTGGVGYELLVPASILERIGGVGDTVRLRTHLEVKEDSLTLFGFQEKAELEIFRLILTVSGVGPRIALSVLSAMTPARVLESIARQDVAAFNPIKGIGKKLAAKIIFELQSKVGELPPAAILASPRAVSGSWAEASDALRSLGYKDQEIQECLAWAGKELPGDPEVTQVVRKALAYFQQSPGR